MDGPEVVVVDDRGAHTNGVVVDGGLSVVVVEVGRRRASSIVVVVVDDGSSVLSECLIVSGCPRNSRCSLALATQVRVWKLRRPHIGLHSAYPNHK